MPDLLVQQESLLEKLLLLEKEKYDLLIVAPWLGGKKTERLVVLLQEQEVLLRDLEQAAIEIETAGSFYFAGSEQRQKLQHLFRTFSELHKKNRIILRKFEDTAQSILKTLEKFCGGRALSIDRQV